LILAQHRHSFFWWCGFLLLLLGTELVYEALFWTRVPSATIFFKAAKNVAFIHLLSLGMLACMVFLMAMEEEPVWSLRGDDSC